MRDYDGRGMRDFVVPDSDKAEISRTIYALAHRIEERQDQLRSAVFVDLDIDQEYPTQREQKLLDALEDGDELASRAETTIDTVVSIVERLFDDYKDEDPWDEMDEEDGP